MSEPLDKNDPEHPPELAEIAKWVLGISGIAIFIVAFLSLWGAYRTTEENFFQTSQLVFNSLLPLLGTWVGTVLAYYFSRKNFESASYSVERMVTLTTDQRLQQLTVAQEMLRISEITLFRIPAGKSAENILLKDLVAKLGGKITRIPIVNDKDVVLYILHQSSLYRFYGEKTLAGKSAVELEGFTLQDLVNDAELKSWVTNIVFVSEKVTVADAKKQMEHQTGCQDLVVTKSGSKNEPMLGWMTNVDIGRLSKA
ncbi:hypothetical protein [Halomonas sp. BM-2019]|uniref:hypothetical protein n=1 Tax=Halomonas sp. BM-2019 TaxID=2811227 RepID=UPI001B3C2CB0|nr:MAG: hypothetical protein J5F18_07535 [Halomonas sp. BM-2019]